MEKTKAKPRVYSAAKVEAILSILEDIVETMHLPVMHRDRLIARIRDVLK
jgi:hypothetical protein